MPKKSNVLGMIGDYLNVMRRGNPSMPNRRSPNANVRNMLSSRPMMSDTETMVVLNRGGRNGNQVSFFPVTEASRKSVSRYNNRQIRRDRENEPVAIQGLMNAHIMGMPSKRGTTEMSGFLNNGQVMGSVGSSKASMGISPRRALNEKRVAQRYANARQVDQIGRMLAPIVGTLGGATLAGMMASRYANNNPAKGKTTSKRSLKKADYFINNAPSREPSELDWLVNRAPAYTINQSRNAQYTPSEQPNGRSTQALPSSSRGRKQPYNPYPQMQTLEWRPDDVATRRTLPWRPGDEATRRTGDVKYPNHPRYDGVPSQFGPNEFTRTKKRPRPVPPIPMPMRPAEGYRHPQEEIERARALQRAFGRSGGIANSSMVKRSLSKRYVR